MDARGGVKFLYTGPMAILLDDATLEVPGPRLGEALQAAQARCEGTGRMLVEVKIDGQTVPGDQLETLAEREVGEAEVRMFSADPQTLTSSILEQVGHRLEEAQTMQTEAADLLQRGESQAGLKKVGEAVEPWLQTQQAVLQSAHIMGIELSTLEVDGEPLQSAINELVTRLKELRDLVNAQDTVGLADVLQYEWPDTTEKWRSLVKTLRQRIGTAQS